MSKETKIADALKLIRSSNYDHDMISYVYVVAGPQKVLLGVVDLREMVLAKDEMSLGDLMVSPVVSAEADDVREDLAELFAKYHYRMLPVVDERDNLLGVIHYNDIMKGLVARVKV
jgi:magnesium transporter